MRDCVFKPGDLLVYAGSPWTATPNERDGSPIIYLGWYEEQEAPYGITFMVYHPVCGVMYLQSLAFSSWNIIARL